MSTEVATVSQPMMLDNLLEMAIRDPSVDVAKLQAVLDMRRQIIADIEKIEFQEAFLRMQAKLPRVKANGVLSYPRDKKDPEGPQKKVCNFAKYEDVWETYQPYLTEEGFTVEYDNAPRPGDGGGMITTCILSRKGHSRRSSIPVPLDTSGGKNNLQGYGSSQSYGMRYSLRAAINFIVEGLDDDGVRGGMRFITDAQAAILRAKCEEAGQPEDYICQRAYRDGSVHNFNEIQAGGYEPILNTLDQMIHQRKRKAGAQ